MKEIFHPSENIISFCSGKLLTHQKNLLQPDKHPAVEAATHIAIFRGNSSLDNASFNGILKTIDNSECVTGY